MKALIGTLVAVVALGALAASLRGLDMGPTGLSRLASAPTPALVPKDEFEKQAWAIADCVRTRGDGVLRADLSETELPKACLAKLKWEAEDARNKKRWKEAESAARKRKTYSYGECHESIPADECAELLAEAKRVPDLAVMIYQVIPGGWRDRKHLQAKGFGIVDVPSERSYVLSNGSRQYYCGPSSYLCKPLR